MELKFMTEVMPHRPYESIVFQCVTSHMVQNMDFIDKYFENLNFY